MIEVRHFRSQINPIGGVISRPRQTVADIPPSQDGPFASKRTRSAKITGSATCKEQNSASE